MSQKFWEGKKVLVTGGAGFIGSNLTDRLVRLGAAVRVVDNLERGKLEYLRDVIGDIDFIQKDLRDWKVCEEVCRDAAIVFHLAAKVGGIKYYLEKPGEVLLQNTLIDAYVLQASLINGVERYLYASSAHVYPIGLQTKPDAPPLKEEDAMPANPELSYGWAKLLGEKQIEYVIEEGTGLRATIVRLIGAYGRHQDLDLETGSAIPVFIRRAIEYPNHSPFVIWGTGEETRSYCYIDDVIDGLVLAVEKLSEHQLLGPINLGSEGRVKIGELAEKVIRISGKDIEPVKDTSRPTVIWGQAVHCSKARELLDGWQPRVSLDEGLRKTYADINERLGKPNVHRL